MLSRLFRKLKSDFKNRTVMEKKHLTPPNHKTDWNTN